MIRRAPGTKMIDAQQPTVYEAMSCGHSSRYRYNADIEEQPSGDKAESWRCAICEIADLKRQLAERDQRWIIALGYIPRAGEFDNLDVDNIVRQSPFVNDIRIAMKDRQDAETQEKVDLAVLAESEWWYKTAEGLYAKEQRLAANRAKVKP